MWNPRRCFIQLALTLLACSAQAQQQRDLRLELRQIEDNGGGYVVGTRPQTPLLTPQMVQVRNGELARVSYKQAVPLQWTQAAQAQGAMTGAGVKQSLVWLQAGQSLLLRPRWSGGQQTVSVEIQMQILAIEPQPEGGLPAQQRTELQTTVRAPLGEWVTVARNGSEPAQGSYRSDAATQRPRLLQLRVTAP